LFVVHTLNALPVCSVSTNPYSSNGSILGGIHGHAKMMMKAMRLESTKVRRTAWKVRCGKEWYEYPMKRIVAGMWTME
jgi:hypothetical protein